MNTDGYFRPPGVIANDLAEHMAQNIVYQVLAPGQRLIEGEICRRFGVSRSPVREALRILENEGLVRRKPRRGIWVAPLSENDADEVYACRMHLECLAAETAARRSASFERGILERSLEDLQSSANDVRAYFEANVAFTKSVQNMAGNETLSRLLRQIARQGERYRYLAYLKESDLIRRSIMGSERVAEAILNGNAATAKAITRDLIQTSWDLVRNHLRQEV